RERLGNVMAHLVDSLRRIAILLQPFLTSTPERIFEQIGVTDDKDKTWDSLRSFGVSTEGAKVTKKDPIFPRLEVEKEVTIIKDMMRAPVEEKADDESEDKKEEVVFDDFMKLDLRVAEVLHAQKMKNADKLLQIQLDLGTEKRQVISGIAQYYQPEELIGKKVICVANLKPVKLRGQLSEGMILSGEDKDGNLSLATVESDLPNGSIVK